MSRVARFAFYCTCGDAMTGEVSPPEDVNGLESAMWTIHSGPGHSRTDGRTARNARRRKDRARQWAAY